MIVSQLNEGACKTYLIGAANGDAMLVDPVLEQVDDYLAAVESGGLRLRYVVDTHVHADHISGGAALRDRTGCDYIMHEHSVSACANKRVSDGDVIRLGELEIRVLHTPGHTQDSISLILPDRILTGDFLFIGEGGAGRTDLPGGDPGDHWDALQKLADLPDEMLVFPAHDYHGRDYSTLGEERRGNPRLAERGRDEYIDWLDQLRLGPADWMADVVKANYACARDPRAAWIPADQPSCEVSGTAGNVNTELVRLISAEELAETLEGAGAPLVLDVRKERELSGELGRIPGVQAIPVGELPHRLDELAGKEDVPIVTVCRKGGRSATAAAILGLAGFSDVRSLEGGMVRWNELGLPTSGEPRPPISTGAGAAGQAPPDLR